MCWSPSTSDFAVLLDAVALKFLDDATIKALFHSSGVPKTSTNKMILPRTSFDCIYLFSIIELRMDVQPALCKVSCEIICSVAIVQ